MQGKVNSWLALKNQMRVWEIVGLIPAHSDPIKRMLYILRTIFINFLGIFSPYTMLVGKAYKAENYLELLECLYLLFLITLAVVKLLNSLNKRHQLLEMRSVFEKLDARATSPEEIQIIENTIKSANHFFVFFMRYMCGGVVVSSLLVVIFSSERALPFPAWYPWDFTKSRTIYIVTVVHEVSVLISIALIEAGNSAYLRAYLLITAHIKTLRLRVLRLGRLQCNGIEKNEKQIYQELARCIDDHAVILQLYDKIRKILSLQGLGQLSVTASVQCFIVIVISRTDFQDLSKIMQMIFVGCLALLQMFILCYSCEMYCKECEELQQAIYGCNWIDQSIRFQKSILFFLHRTQKIDEIRAGNLIALNYPTFLSVVKFSYSLFAILNKSGQR